jgi:hypothetical protein
MLGEQKDGGTRGERKWDIEEERKHETKLAYHFWAKIVRVSRLHKRDVQSLRRVPLGA